MRDCGVLDTVGPSYPTLTDSVAAAFGLSLLLFAIGSPSLFSLFRRPNQQASQLIRLWLVISVSGALGVSLSVSTWSPSVSAAVPTQGEVMSVLLIALVPAWLLVTGCFLVLVRFIATRWRAAMAQPN